MPLKWLLAVASVAAVAMETPHEHEHEQAMKRLVLAARLVLKYPSDYTLNLALPDPYFRAPDGQFSPRFHQWPLSMEVFKWGLTMPMHLPARTRLSLVDSGALDALATQSVTAMLIQCVTAHVAYLPVREAFMALGAFSSTSRIAGASRDNMLRVLMAALIPQAMGTSAATFSVASAPDRREGIDAVYRSWGMATVMLLSVMLARGIAQMPQPKAVAKAIANVAKALPKPKPKPKPLQQNRSQMPVQHL